MVLEPSEHHPAPCTLAGHSERSYDEASRGLTTWDGSQTEQDNLTSVSLGPGRAWSHAASVPFSSTSLDLWLCLHSGGTGAPRGATGAEGRGRGARGTTEGAGAYQRGKLWPPEAPPWQPAGVGRRPGASQQTGLAGFWLLSLSCATLTSYPPGGGNSKMPCEEEINPVQHLRRF